MKSLRKLDICHGKIFVWPAVSSLKCAEVGNALWHKRTRSASSSRNCTTARWVSHLVDEPGKARPFYQEGNFDDQLGMRKPFQEGAVNVLFIDESSDKQDFIRFLGRVQELLYQISQTVKYRRGLEPGEAEVDLHGRAFLGLRKFFFELCSDDFDEDWDSEDDEEESDVRFGPSDLSEQLIACGV